MAAYKVLTVDLTRRQAADVARAVSWHLNPFRSLVNLPVHRYAAIAFIHAAKSLTPKSMFLAGHEAAEDNAYVRGLRIRCEIDEHLLETVQAQYRDGLIVFPGDRDDTRLRECLGLLEEPLEWVEFSIDLVRRESQVRGEGLQAAMQQDQKRFMTELLKKDVKAIVARSTDSKFIELSQQLADFNQKWADGIAAVISRQSEILARLDELIPPKK